ncbi:MAG: chain-length determining protein [Gammaproteobacteria bacterium]|nr:chain-length determining protein [Gammaproteobacteria bacterium]
MHRMQFFRKRFHWFACLLSIVLVSAYWFFWASDRYVSESNVVLESPQISLEILASSSILGSQGVGARDMLLLRDHLLSVDMLRTIDRALGFREHYANRTIDYFSRLGGIQVPIEELYDYYLGRISVELDEYAQVLRIRVQAFAPGMAHRIATFLLENGEAHMNAMGQRLAEEQVRFLERQVEELNDRFNTARRILIDYQNENGLVSPSGVVESLSQLVANLEVQLANLKAKRAALVSFQSPKSPEVLRVDSEIDALKQQITQGLARMAQKSGGALNVMSSEYQTLELKAQFAQESYAGALAALESTRIDAARKLKQVSILQTPTLPEYPMEPERLYNTVVFAIITLFLGLIYHMLLMIIEDHRD